MRKSYNEIPKNSVDGSNFNFLVVTATEVETKAILEIMPDEIIKIISGDHTYHLGQVGLYNIIHVQCSQMGSLNPGGSTSTIGAALNEWPQIKAVIMVGICFGFNNKKQKIGDVVVSTSIKNYETRRVGKKQEIPRGGTYQADKCLINAFKNLEHTWENIGLDNKKKNLILGDYVSGEQLVDNIEARNKLLAETPEAKAGEMEGNGLVASCENARKPWIIAKAICDYGDGNKKRNKEKRQSIAAASSAQCCEAVLGQATAFKSIDIFPIQNEVALLSEDKPDVLFEVYKKEFEPFFLRRSVDTYVESYLSCHSLWVYGISGVGKTTSILHALLRMDKRILLINMAGIGSNSTLEEIFEWIYNEVAIFVGETSIAPNTYQLCARKIIALLDKYYSGTSVYVLVEEIPFSGESFKAFVTSFSSMVVSNSLSGATADVHFVLSSIENPIPYIPAYLQKVKSMVKFLEFEKWTSDECIGLIDLVQRYINTPTIKNKDEMIFKCNLLPRHIKYVFRESYQTGNKKEIDAVLIDEILRRLL